MKNVFLYLFLTFCSIGISQTDNYVNGYYIDNSGAKINCLVENSDWVYNPTTILIKKELSNSPTEISINDAKEFGLDGKSKYIKATVAIDNSKGEPDFSVGKEPNFETQTVFLKVLVEGKNSLYSYENNMIPIKLLFKTNLTEIKQLVFKKYIDSNENSSNIYLNEDYKKQLFSYAKCEKGGASRIESLKYNANTLIDYFNYLNACQGDTTSTQISKKRNTEVAYKLLLSANSQGINFIPNNEGKLYGIPFSGNNALQNKVNLGFGFEIEFKIPTKKNNWSIYIDPSYNTFKTDGTITSTFYINPNYSTGLVNADYPTVLQYNFIQIPIGIRRYIDIYKKSKINLSLAFNTKFAFNSYTYIKRPNNNAVSYLMYEDLKGNTYNFNFGIGYDYKKIGIELCQFTNTNLNPAQNNYNFRYQNTSLVLRYRLK